jgi:hypothetical protein
MINYLKANWVPVLSAIVLFFIVSVAYFTPAIQGKILSQHDKVVWQGASKESKDFKEETGEQTLWTNSMFSGMPTYLINNLSDGNKLKILHRLFVLDNSLRPIPYLFLYLLGFFIALLAFRVNPWLSIVGAFAFAFSSYFFIIIQAGHITKAIAIGYMAPIIAGVYLAYNKKELWGAVLMAFFLSFQIIANHLQITYYTFLIILIFVIFQFVNSIREKQIRPFFKSSSYLIVGAILAVGTNFLSISTVYDYGKDSIRGASELTSEQSNRTSGLDKDYATDWSYGIFESLNTMVPNLMGGASQSDLGTKSETYDVLKSLGQPNAKQIVKQMPSYWGDQPFTSGPTYIGALVIFLFVLGLFVVKGQLKWWLLTATILSFMLAWGKNMMWFTDIFLDYFPGYNKFRAVSMTLVMAELTMPLLGILGLQRIISGDYDPAKIKKQLLYALGITGGTVLFLLAALPASSTAFVGANDAAVFGQNDMLLEALQNDRASMFQKDALRSLFFIILGAAAVFLILTQKIKRNAFIVIIGLALVLDLWPIAKRYMNNDHFVRESKAQAQFKPSVADESILRDTDSNYRVLNLSVSTFNDASTSYFHKSIGGYHGAKMRRYQELITHYIAPEIQQFGQALSNNATQQSVQQALAQLKVVGMLNGKYIIYNPQAPAIPNSYALGNAWFVNEIKVVANADEELAELSNIAPSNTAIVDKRFKANLFDFTKDPVASIQFLEYKPNYLKYESNASSDQLAVFSEVFYDKGWKAFVDGEEVPHFRVNYILRAMKVPAGQHTIEFKFMPEIYTTGIIVGAISSVLLLLLFASGFWYDRIKAKKELE